MTNPTDTAEEAARAKLSWIESECPAVYDALILDVSALLRERERAGIERAAKWHEQQAPTHYHIDYSFHNSSAKSLRALLTKEGT